MFGMGLKTGKLILSDFGESWKYIDEKTNNHVVQSYINKSVGTFK